MKIGKAYTFLVENSEESASSRSGAVDLGVHGNILNYL
jgi:hypothetical protein